MAQLVKELNPVYERWLQAEKIKLSYGVISDSQECRRFYEGDQYAPVTKATKNMQRPVNNICQYAVNQTVSNVSGTPIVLNFLALGEKKSTEVVTQFVNYKLKQIGFKQKYEQAIEGGEVEGTYILFIPWDNNQSDPNSNYEGQPILEEINIEDFNVADFSQQDVQKQEWIIIRIRKNVREVREEICTKLTKEEKLAFINPDDDEYNSEFNEADDKKTTIYLMFFRQDGEVYFIYANANKVLTDAMPLNPNKIDDKTLKELGLLEADSSKEEIDGDKVGVQSIDETDKNIEFKFDLYPVAVLRTVPKKNSFYGLGLVKQILPNQKLINWLEFMNALNIQNVAWGKILAKKGALGNQRITNEPGQILFDYSVGNTFGITNLPGQQTLANGAVSTKQQLIDLTFTLANANEIISTDILGKLNSGTAIAQAEAIKKKQVDLKERRCHRFAEDIGKILFKYFVTRYSHEPYARKFSTGEYDALMNYAKENELGGAANQYIAQEYKDTFNGEDFIELSCDVICEAGSGSQFSEISEMQLLSELFQMKAITFKQFIECYPDNLMRNKASLLQYANEVEQGQMAQLQAANEQLQSQIDELTQRLKVSVSYNEASEKSFKERIKELATNNDSMKKFLTNTPAKDDGNNVA